MAVCSISRFLLRKNISRFLMTLILGRTRASDAIESLNKSLFNLYRIDKSSGLEYIFIALIIIHLIWCYQHYLFSNQGLHKAETVPNISNKVFNYYKQMRRRNEYPLPENPPLRKLRQESDNSNIILFKESDEEDATVTDYTLITPWFS